MFTAQTQHDARHRELDARHARQHTDGVASSGLVTLHQVGELSTRNIGPGHGRVRRSRQRCTLAGYRRDP